jgi:hypothetical protein
MGENLDNREGTFGKIKVNTIQFNSDRKNKLIKVEGNLSTNYYKFVSSKIFWFDSFETNGITKAEVGVHGPENGRFMRILGYERLNKKRHILLEGDEIMIKSKNMHTNGNMTMGSNVNRDEVPPGTIAVGDVYLTSSIEFKENIETLSSKEAFNIIENLEPVKFTYKNDTEKNLKIGFIAENIPDITSSKDHKNVKVMEIISAMTKVVKEQQNTIESMSKEISELKKRINTNNR